MTFVDKFTKRTGRHPAAGALVGYITFLPLRGHPEGRGGHRVVAWNR
jgi:hypothetical protein